ncbi:MAG TPA: trypco2 family protein [Actinomycetes bacterium]|jgi:hypothetical protein|nr:trypco2 family protein [Actinomycetes bacterium]
MTEVEVELSEAISALRRELEEAMKKGSQEALRFRMGLVELEFELVVRRAAEAQGGVQFWVASVGGKGSLSRDSRHRVKLMLQPVDEEGDDLEVRSEQLRRPA